MSKLLFKYRKASGDYNYKGVAADNFECGLALDEEAPLMMQQLMILMLMLQKTIQKKINNLNSGLAVY